MPGGIRLIDARPSIGPALPAAIDALLRFGLRTVIDFGTPPPTLLRFIVAIGCPLIPRDPLSGLHQIRFLDCAAGIEWIIPVRESANYLIGGMVVVKLSAIS